MTVQVTKLAQRRGACPGLSAPMATGDGLLVRLTPTGTMPLDAFAALCAAARHHGNGVVEITARGNIQVRGLSAASAPRFAASIAALDIAAAEGIAVVTNALAGLDPAELIDASALAADLRHALARSSLAARLGAKVSVVIDGGGSLNLDAVAADLRMSAFVASGEVSLGVGIGGDAACAADVGAVAPSEGVVAAMRLLEVIARRGREARARDILAAEGTAIFRAALASDPASCRIPTSSAPSESKDVNTRHKPGHQGAGEALGTHRLRDGSFACGIGLAFGHADAMSLQQLAEAAEAVAASGMRAAPGRVLLIIGLTHAALVSLTAAAEKLGFIVRADDRRRNIVACAGAPMCASAHIATRSLAPLIADAAGPHLDGSFKIHISGCPKGCAHPAPAALTIVGTPAGCALIAHGSTGDAPLAVVPTDRLVAAVANSARDLQRETRHG